MSLNFNGALIGFCNPLLDIVASVDEGLLEEYGLLPDNSMAAEAHHAPLFDILLSKYNAVVCPGGSGQNTLRGAQLLLPPGSTVYFGAVGDDENGKRLKDVVEKTGLSARYMVNPNVPTGVCAVLVTGNNRSIVADISAGGTYSFEHIQQPENWAVVEQAKCYYVTGFFLTISRETANILAVHAFENGKTFAMNTSATFVPEEYKDVISELFPYVDIMFGNESEAKSFAGAFGFEDTENIKSIVKHIADMPRNGAKPRIVVITQGSDQTLVATSDSELVRAYSVLPIPESEMCDTNGAGDAFVAGFLAQLIKGQSVDVCIESGHWLAGQVVRRIGATFPEGPIEFTPSETFSAGIKELQ